MPDEKILGGENSSVEQGSISEKQGGNEDLGGISLEQKVEAGAEGTQERIEGKYNEILSKVTPQTTTNQTSDNHVLDAKSIGETIDEESKIQKLVDLASTKGVVYAVKVARSLGDYYALDRMHDELVDKFYEGLLEKGLIQKD
ncbi:MAG: hypothetical protein WCG73_02410 [Candidatus Moraniibacteriota bacterium]